MKISIPDVEERKRALDITSHVHVESPAGAGKTGLIVERILALLSIVNHPSEILAVTFTRKAAAEMKERVVEILKAAADGKMTGDQYIDSLIEKGKKAISMYSGLKREMLLSGTELQITTIHGFCLRICRRAPLESGLEPGLRLLEEHEQESLQELAAKEVINTLFSRPKGDPFRAALEARFLMHNMNARGIISEIASLISKRDQLADLISEVPLEDPNRFLDKSRENLIKIVEAHLKKLEGRIKKTIFGEKWEDFRGYLAENNASCLDCLPVKCPTSDWRDLGYWQGLAEVFLTKNGTIRKRWGPKQGGFPSGFSATTWGLAASQLDSEFEAYLSDIQRYPSPDILKEELDAVGDLILIVSMALKKYRELCRAKGVIDYVDLELGALKALGSVENVTDSVLFWDRAIRHILIDEFQDTSSTEYKILQHLVGGWQEGDGRTLFLVGDPKQSIYRFRKADVSVFYRAEKGIDREGLEPIKLDLVKLKANFRSSASLIEWTNRLFGETVMSMPRIEYDEVRFIEALPASKDPNRDYCPELALFIKDEEDESPRQKEARYLAWKVSECLRQLKDGETIGVLLFTRTHLPIYLQAFREAGVPAKVKEGLKLSTLPEVAHLANLARAIVRPHDQLSWVACMRSPWLMLAISDIKEVLEADGVTIFQKLKNVESIREEFSLFQSAMTRARARIGRGRLGDVVRQAWVDMGGPEKVGAYMGLDGVNACLKFLEQLNDVEESTSEETLEKMELLLDRFYDPGGQTVTDSPVSIMTVHGAKGLEFDHCFIPWLDYSPLRSGTGEKPAYLSDVLEGVSLIASRPDRRVDKDKTLYDFLLEIEKRKTVAEAKRLFYVAVTRARKTLFMSGVWSGKSLPKGPLGWLLKHIGIRKLTDDVSDGVYESTRVSINPEESGENGVVTMEEEPRAIPAPEPFNPEPLPFKVRNPSAFGYVADEEKNEEEADRFVSMAVGTVIHRLIEQMSMGMDIPEYSYVRRLLVMEGLSRHDADRHAADILKELNRCSSEPFFRWIIGEDFKWSASEWSIEALTSKKTITSGIVDRVVFDGEHYWVVDYKTHRPHPGESEMEFVRRMKDRFRAQLEAYKDLVARVKQVKKNCVRTGIYLTHISKWVEI